MGCIMKRLLACLALAAILVLAAAPRVQAIMTKEDAEKQGIKAGQNARQQKVPRGAGTIQAPDGAVIVVPQAKPGPKDEDSGPGLPKGGVKQQ